ncbi:MAG: response regulator transcription factor [Actinobacteria bacterium]|nr:response regulator transcription factor [Actinomycetota bacterium]MCA1739298.1 response regulator transcription factor [Actinomycetota bacterium]
MAGVSAVIRVAIVDDQPLFTDGLGRIVGAQPGMEVVGVAHDGESGVKMCQELRPDVILMDINMPVMDGVTATSKVRDLLPDTKVLILTVHADDMHVFRGIKAGATGYLLKDCTPEDLSRAISTVHAGDTIMAPEIARKMLLAFEEAHEEPEAPTLSNRELDVVKALARGQGNKQIARGLSISEKTVRNHVSNIYKKLHVYDRTQTVLYAIREGLIEADGFEER